MTSENERVGGLEGSDAVRTSPTATSTCIERCFSPFGSDQSCDVVNYVIYEWASKVTNISFNICLPLLIAAIGNAAIGNNEGKILWSYLSATTQALTALSFLTFTSILEFGCMKRKALIRFSFAAAIFMISFIFCFEPGSVYFASVLAVGCQICQSIGSVSFDSLLDAVSVGKKAYSISSRSSITGYCGMAVFLLFAAPILAIFYYGVTPTPSTLWIEGIIPLVLTGLWYLIFLLKISWRLSPELGKGPPMPLNGASWRSFDSNISSCDGCDRQLHPYRDNYAVKPGISILRFASVDVDLDVDGNEKALNLNDDGNKPPTEGKSHSKLNDDENHCTVDEPNQAARYGIFNLIGVGFVRGAQMQLQTISTLHQFPDLAWFILAFVFLQGATNTATSVAVIVANEVLGASITVIIAATVIGLFGAILGTILCKKLVEWNIASLKSVLVANIIIVAGLTLYTWFITTDVDIYIAALIGGSQIGPINAFARTIVSRLVPRQRQSRLFSFYQFSQQATGWIGNLIVATVTKVNGGGATVYLHSIVICVFIQIGLGLPCLLLMNFKRGEEVRSNMDKNVNNLSSPLIDQQRESLLPTGQPVLSPFTVGLEEGVQVNGVTNL